MSAENNTDATTEAILARLEQSPSELRQLALDVLRFRDEIRDTRAHIEDAVSQFKLEVSEMKRFLDSRPQSPEYIALGEKVLQFTDALDQMSKSQRRNVDQLLELTPVVEKLLKLPVELQENAQFAITQTRDAALESFKNVIGKFKLPKILSVRETLLFHGTAYGVIILLLVALVATMILRK